MKANAQGKQIKLVVITAVMSALIFVANYIQLPIFVPIGDITRIHFGNAFCILAGLICGPVYGGLAAGIGSGLYDLLSPLYITSAPFTFIFKFILASLPGLCVLFAKKRKLLWGMIGAVIGQIAYVILYLSKSYIQGILEGSAPEALIPSIVTKLGASTANAIIAVIISSILYSVLYKAIKASKLLD